MTYTITHAGSFLWLLASSVTDKPRSAKHWNMFFAPCSRRALESRLRASRILLAPYAARAW